MKPLWENALGKNWESIMTRENYGTCTNGYKSSTTCAKESETLRISTGKDYR